MKRIARLGRHLVLDVSPLRRSRDLRCLVVGQLLSTLGGQLTTVAVPYQVYLLTRSSLNVGLVSLATVLPLIAGALLGGSLADAVDRRKILLIAQSMTLLCSAGLAVNADTGPVLWPLFALPSMAAGFAAATESGLSAVLPNLVRRSEVAAVNAMFQALFQIGQVAGPAVAGLLLAGAGVRFVYWMDVATMAAAIAATFLMGPQVPQVPQAGAGHRPGLRSIAAGFSFLRGRPVIQGAYLIDINATVFGMPRAVFPALALTVFGGGARTLGFLYAAPGVGALLGAVTAGWIPRIRRQGRAVIAAVIVWGAAITCFGLVRWLPAALALLAVAGCADVISAVFRGTIIQLGVPDELRGRMMGMQMAAVAGAPRIGDAESGAVAAAFTPLTSVVSGGLACIAGALILARLLPAFRRQTAPATHPDPAPAAESPRTETGHDHPAGPAATGVRSGTAGSLEG
jgi:predicted MFS family arabinose efflux permease